MFTLDDLTKLAASRNVHEDRAQRDRELYLKGRRMYPTAPEEALPQGTTERDRGCYMMGWSATKELGYEN